MDQFRNIENLIEDRPLVFFCGAGISRESNLPAVKDSYEFLSTILTDKPDRTVLSDYLCSWRLPFERIMQTLIDGSGSDSFLSLYQLGLPGRVHTLIAKLASAGKVKRIITTNFDLLFERALSINGLVDGKDFKVYYSEDDFEQAILEKNKLIQVIKLHGSAGETERHRKSLRITIETIANQLLNNKRQKIVEDIFESAAGDLMIFLGYSFSDKFDITPHIRQIKKTISAHVIVVKHAASGSAIITNSLDSIPSFHNKILSGHLVKVPTGDIIDYLWNKFFPDTLYKATVDTDKLKWQDIFSHWLDQLKRPFCKYYISSKLFDLYRNNTLMLKYATKSFTALTSKEEAEWSMLVRIQYIFSLFKNTATRKDEIKVEGRLSELLGSLEKTKDINNLRKQQLLSIVTFQKGRILEIMERRNDAVKMFCNCYRIDYRLDDKLGMSKTLHQLGYNINQQKREDNKIAIKVLLRSLQLKRQVGYVSGMALTHHELGNSYFINGAKDEQAKYHYKLAAELAEDIGEISLIPRVKTMLGMVDARLENHAEAIIYFQEALRLKEPHGENDSLAITCYNFSTSLFAKDDYTEGFLQLSRAKNIYARLERKQRYMDCITQELSLFSKFVIPSITEEYLDKEIEKVLFYLEDMPSYEKGYFLFEYSLYLYNHKKDYAGGRLRIEQAFELLKNQFFERMDELSAYRKLFGERIL